MYGITEENKVQVACLRAGPELPPGLGRQLLPW